MSKKHAIITVSEDGSVILKDLKSLNKTFVNKKMVEPETVITLSIGDKIQFGKGRLSSRSVCIREKPI